MLLSIEGLVEVMELPRPVLIILCRFLFWKSILPSYHIAVLTPIKISIKIWRSCGIKKIQNILSSPKRNAYVVKNCGSNGPIINSSKSFWEPPIFSAKIIATKNQIKLTEISIRPNRDFISTNCVTSSFLRPHRPITEPEQYRCRCHVDNRLDVCFLFG